ncbi:MAG TPA: response regulator [Acidimicrobiia bacterium]|nr:response regulator [Acidimicrobiia bacterium]
MPSVGQDQNVLPEVNLDDVRVVAVDSRTERLRVMRRLLEHSFEPSEIVEADSPEAAVDLVGRCQPEIVVLEIQMPLEVGLDTIETLSRMSPRPRIVVCSFRHDAATVRAAHDRGADAYLAKPAGAFDLRNALRAPPAEDTVRHRPPNERPVSPSPLRNPAPSLGTKSTP